MNESVAAAHHASVSVYIGYNARDMASESNRTLTLLENDSPSVASDINTHELRYDDN